MKANDSGSPQVRALVEELPWLLRVARRESFDHNLIDDLVQQVYLRALLRPPSSLRPRALRSWLIAVLRSIHRDHLRSEDSRKFRESWMGSLRCEPDDPSNAATDEEERRQVRHALESLREPYRTAVHLRYVEGLNSRQIACRQGISPDLARQHVSRGIRYLRRHLNPSDVRGLFVLPALAALRRSWSLVPWAVLAGSLGAVLLVLAHARENPGASLHGIETLSAAPEEVRALGEVTAPRLPLQTLRTGNVMARTAAIRLALPDELSANSRMGRDGLLWRPPDDRGRTTILAGASGKWRSSPDEPHYEQPGAIWFLTYQRSDDGDRLVEWTSWPPVGTQIEPAPAREELFGMRVAALPDLDGNGIREVAVGAPRADGCDGAVWILSVDAHDRVFRARPITTEDPALAALRGRATQFGSSVVSIDDIDGNGLADLVVGAAEANEARGELWLLALDADASVLSARPLLSADLEVSKGDRLGFDVCTLPDLDADGCAELVAGAPWDDEAGPDRGALWILRLNYAGDPVRVQKVLPPRGWSTCFGVRVADAGDLDGDARCDLLVSDSQRSFVLYLGADGRPAGTSHRLVGHGAFAVWIEADGHATFFLGRPQIDDGRGGLRLKEAEIDFLPLDVGGN